MKQKFYILVLTLLLFQHLHSQERITGVQGVTVTPRIVNMSDMPFIGDINIGPVYDGIFNEGEPPYSKPYPVPNAENLPHFTYDKSSGNQYFALGMGINFEGITQGGYIPSEPQPAVGPNHIVIIGNVSIKITDKNGTILQNTTQEAFFGIPSAEAPGFDAKCFYDARRNRFLLLTETFYNPAGTANDASRYYVAISQTNNAMGLWYIYTFNMHYDGSTLTNNWADFPGLGISDDKLVMSGQMYTFSTNSYQYNKLRIVDRAAMYSGSSVSYVDIYNWSGSVFVTKPGRNIMPGDTIHLIATRYAGGTDMQYRRLTGPPSSPVLSGAYSIPLSAYSIPPDAPGGSGTVTVNTGDSRTPDFFIRNGILYLCFHAGVNIGGGSTESVLKYVKLQVSPLNTTPLTDETYGAADVFYYYPMVCADSVGTIFIGFGRSSVSEYPSSYVTGKRRNDSNIQSSALAKSGTAVTSQTRWGDYTGIDMDESASTNGVSYAWYSGQWTKASNNFGTWVTQLSFTYGRISGQVLDDADGDVSTTGDRTPVPGVTVTLKQGSSTIATTISDGSGNYIFGYLETASNYSVEFTPPVNKHSVDVMPGSGATSQTKTNYKTIAINLTNSQTSSSNNYLISDWIVSVSTGNWNSASSWADNTIPVSTDKALIAIGTTITINTNPVLHSLNIRSVLAFDNIVSRTLTVNNTLILSNTSIQLGNNNLIIGTGGSITGVSSSRYIITNGTGTLTINGIGALNKLFPVGISSTYNPVTINNSGVADNFSVNVTSTLNPPPIDPAKVVNRLWTITEGTAGGSNVTLTLQYNTGDYPVTFNNSAGNIVIGRHNGSAWLETPATWSNPSSNVYTATASGFTQFSPFAIGNSGALPIELTAFTYTIDGRDVILNWETAKEINNRGFDIERAEINKDGSKSNWRKLGFVQGGGNTNTSKRYIFHDRKLNTGKYNYRLKQIDYNGNFEYYDLNSEIMISKPLSFDVSQNYPNPSNPKSKIDYQIPIDAKVMLKIYDVTGREVATVINEQKEAGYHTAEFDGTSLASGIYIYRLTADGKGQSYNKVMKLVLIK